MPTNHAPDGNILSEIQDVHYSATEPGTLGLGLAEPYARQDVSHVLDRRGCHIGQKPDQRPDDEKIEVWSRAGHSHAGAD